MFFLFIKQGKSIAISLYFAITVILTLLNNSNLNTIAKVLRTIPGLSKHFLKIYLIIKFNKKTILRITKQAYYKKIIKKI